MAAAPTTSRDRGIQLLKEGFFADSIEFLLQAINENPTDIDLYLYLGMVYARQDNLDMSIDILEQAIDIAPTSAKAHYNLGVAYHKLHNLTQAKDEYLRALGLDPSYTSAKQALDAVTSAQSAGETEAKKPQIH